jgi:hypothetical protein
LFDGVIQYAQFGFFGDIPNGPATVDAVVGALVAILAQRNAQELLVLLNVVGVRRARRPANPARHLFNGGQMPSFSGAQAVVHLFS